MAFSPDAALIHQTVTPGTRSAPGSASIPSQATEDLGAFLAALIENYRSEKPVSSNEPELSGAAGGPASSDRKRSARGQDVSDPASDLVSARDAAATIGLTVYPSAVFVAPVDHPLSWMFPDSAEWDGVAGQSAEQCLDDRPDGDTPDPAGARTQTDLGVGLPFPLAVPVNQDVAQTPPTGSTDFRDAPPVPGMKPAASAPVAATREKGTTRTGEPPGAQLRSLGPTTIERKPLPEVMTGEMRPRFIQVETAPATPSRLLDRVAAPTADPAPVQPSVPVTAASGRHPARLGIPLHESAIDDAKSGNPVPVPGAYPSETDDHAGSDQNRNPDRQDRESPAPADPRHKVQGQDEQAPPAGMNHSRPESHQEANMTGANGMPAAERPVHGANLRESDSAAMRAPSVASQAAQTGSEAPQVQSVQIQLEDESGTGVNLRFVESGGGVRVSVRTQDASLADAMNANSHALEGRLQAAGWSSEFRPAAGMASALREAAVSDARPAQETTARGEAAQPVVRGTQMGFGAGTSDSSGERPSTWADQNEDLLTAIALRRLANKGAKS